MARRVLIALLSLHSFACASVLRSSKHDVTIYGPQDLQVFDGARPVPLQQEEDQGGRVKYSASVDRHVRSLTFKSQAQQSEVPLGDHVSAGYLILDLVLFWPIAFIDWATGSWNSFDDINAAGVTQRQASFAPQPGSEPPARPTPGRALSAAPPPQPPPPPPARGTVLDSGVLAVLDFKNFARDLQPEDVRYFADVVRGATLRAAPGLRVMTRENLLVLLQATGKDAANCEGECEVDTGRRIGADAVISGEILKVGTHYKISLKLHETREGRLLATTVASGKTIDELDESAQQAAGKLLLR